MNENQLNIALKIRYITEKITDHYAIMNIIQKNKVLSDAKALILEAEMKI